MHQAAKEKTKQNTKQNKKINQFNTSTETITVMKPQSQEFICTRD